MAVGEEVGRGVAGEGVVGEEVGREVGEGGEVGEGVEAGGTW